MQLNLHVHVKMTVLGYFAKIVPIFQLHVTRSAKIKVFLTLEHVLALVLLESLANSVKSLRVIHMILVRIIQHVLSISSTMLLSFNASAYPDGPGYFVKFLTKSLAQKFVRTAEYLTKINVPVHVPPESPVSFVKSHHVLHSTHV